MTDPTTRYPLPDDPGTDPLAAGAPAVDAVPAAADPPPTVAADADSPPPTAPPPPSAIGVAPPPTPPAWTPPAQRENRWPAVLFGFLLLAVGLWFFAEVTLGIDLPTIRWGQLWPLILIVVGVLILYGARLGRKR